MNYGACNWDITMKGHIWSFGIALFLGPMGLFLNSDYKHYIDWRKGFFQYKDCFYWMNSLPFLKEKFLYMRGTFSNWKIEAILFWPFYSFDLLLISAIKRIGFISTSNRFSLSNLLFWIDWLCAALAYGCWFFCQLLLVQCEGYQRP